MYDNTFGEWVCGECGWWPWGLWLCDDDRGPQSTQSVPRLQAVYWAPGPPSSQSPSEAQLHVFEQVCPTVSLSWRRSRTKVSIERPDACAVVIRICARC